MSTVSATRMELLARKAQIALARQGRELLEQKRSALLKEFMHTADVAMLQSNVLHSTASDARQTLARAEALCGAEMVQSAALAARTEFALDVTTSNVMGIKVPHIEQKHVARSMLGRGYGIVGTSIAVDETAEAFEKEVAAIIQMAETELRLTRLGSEIRRTSRRLNALDHFLIPRLESECDFIQNVLNERERSDHFRLKLVKRSLECGRSKS